MSLKTPIFWYRDRCSPQTREEKLLSPFSMFYALGHKIHQHFEKPKQASVPVLCVGNINAGGSGKTPAALALMDIIQRHNIVNAPYFLSRGYGGSAKTAITVSPETQSYNETGEEALILAQKAPTIVSQNRFKGAEKAIDDGADLILMDDGLQNRSLIRDITFVVVDGAMGFGNQKLLPAGPLRQPLNEGFMDSDAFILIGEDRRKILKTLPVDTPVFRAHLQINEQNLPEKNQKYIAFAGLGYPQKFFNTLNENGYDIVQNKSFPDHHEYTSQDLEKLYKTAIEMNAQLITTKKDFMRLPEDFKQRVQVLSVYLSFENEPVLTEFLKSRLSEIA